MRAKGGADVDGGEAQDAEPGAHPKLEHRDTRMLTYSRIEVTTEGIAVSDIAGTLLKARAVMLPT